MKDKGLDRGLVQDFDTSAKRGKNHYFGFRKMFWDYMNKMHVPFSDDCCDLAPTSTMTFPVRFNSETGALETYNGTTWVETSGGGGALATGITAFATGGQTNATALTIGYNEITTVATAGDSVKLPTASVNLTVIVKNEGAASLDVFPFLADTINDGAANLAISIAPGATVVFTAINSTNWEASNQVISTNTISEQTVGSGVTVDGVLVKDSSIALADGTVGNLAVKLGADTNNGIYGISDTQMGFAVEGVLVGGTDTAGFFTGNIAEQVGGAGVTVDSLLLKDGGASANSMFAGFFPTIASQALSGAGAVNVTAYLTKYTSTGGAQALTIASGAQIGQRKKVQHIVDGGSGVMTGVYVGGTTITFTTAGEFVDLIWTGTAWGVLELGSTVSITVIPVLA